MELSYAVGPPQSLVDSCITFYVYLHCTQFTTEEGGQVASKTIGHGLVNSVVSTSLPLYV